jgi:hypothetical protein
MFRKSNLPFLFLSILVIFGLLSALAPISDFDQDGNLDSLLTEGFLWLPALSLSGGLFTLFDRRIAAYLATPRYFSLLLVPPPIAN